MNPQVPDELISAYFDGEVSPEERAAVERLLASSEDAQRELNETARLSALLHSFPRESAPVELVGNVLRQTNQLPLPAQSAPSKTAESTRNASRDWKVGLASAAATIAAGLLAMALNAHHMDEPKMAHIASGTAPADVAPAPAPAAAKSTELSEADIQMDVASHVATKRGFGAGAVAESTDEAGGMPGQAPASGLATPMMRSRSVQKASEPEAPLVSNAKQSLKSQAPGEPMVADRQQIDASELGQTEEELLRGIRENKIYVGTVIPQLADPENNVGMLGFQVVDIDKSSELIQVLLKKNSIEPRSMNNDGKATPNDLVFIYIVAPGDKLANTVEDIRNHVDLIRNVVAYPPVQVASLDDEAKQQMQKKDETVRGGAERKERQAAKSDSATSDEENAEFQEVLKAAMNQRNGIANPIMGNNAVTANGQVAQSRDGLENSTRQQFADSVREKGKTEGLPRVAGPAASQAQNSGAVRGNSAYDMARVNNSVVANNTVPLSGMNTAQTQNPFRAEAANGFNVRRQMAYSNPDKAMNNDSNRALRMLFVLQPQSEAAAAVPATSAPAKPQ